MAKSKRIALSKKTRFEVFKRDSFKCQYCGRSAPEVVLHVDHIHPVSKDGTNDVFNLITACSDCNHGKGATRLSDDSSLKKQKKQLDELNEKREQLEMMMAWRQELANEKDQMFNFAVERYETIFFTKLSEYGLKLLRGQITQFGFDAVMAAMDITSTRDIDPEGRLNYMAGICWNKKREAAQKAAALEAEWKTIWHG